LTPAALNFGPQTVGTTSAGKNITVTNHEKVVVTFTDVTITGADSSEFAQINTCTSLSPGGTCQVTVTFTPASKGAQTATLTITDSATNSPQTAKLSGTGH
jgi:P pilus assembly chaperone PapD